MTDIVYSYARVHLLFAQIFNVENDPLNFQVFFKKTKNKTPNSDH